MPKNTSACGEVVGTCAMFWNIAHVKDLTYLITNLAFCLDCRPRNVFFVIFRINPHKNNQHYWSFTLFFMQKWQRFIGPRFSNVRTFIFVCHSLSYVTVHRISVCRQTNHIQDHPTGFFSGLKMKMENSPSNGKSEAVVSTSFHHTRSSCTGALIGQTMYGAEMIMHVHDWCYLLTWSQNWWTELTCCHVDPGVSDIINISLLLLRSPKCKFKKMHNIMISWVNIWYFVNTYSI